MRKILSLLLPLLLLLLLASCDGGKTCNHVEEIIPAVPGTCSESGLSEGTRCSVCGETLKAQAAVTPPHSFDADGKCTECGHEIEFTEGLKFEAITATEYAVSGRGSSSDTVIYIPREYKGKPVTAIGDKAFAGCEDITSVWIPECVISIGERSFDGCTALEEINLHDGIRAIGKKAFRDCEHLFSIQDGLTYVDKYVVDADKSLESVKWRLDTLGVGGDAFYNCDVLTSVAIPKSVIFISNSAFVNCDILSSVTLPDGLEIIDDYAFYECKSLSAIKIPTSVKYVGDSAFYECRALTAVYTDDLVAWLNIDFGNYTSNPMYHAGKLYVKDALLTEVTIPEFITEIKPHTFCNARDLRSVTLHDKITKIGDNAFIDCASLGTIAIPSSVKRIGYAAFFNCTSLTAVYITDMSAWLDLDFANYSSNPLFHGKKLYLNGDIVDDLVITEPLEKIRDFTFYNCESLISIEIPDGAASIGYESFRGCKYLQNIKVPDSVHAIADFAFYECGRLKAVTVPEGVTKIGTNMFYGCFSLSRLDLPSTITVIGYHPFEGCSSLRTFTFAGTVEQWKQMERIFGWDYGGRFSKIVCADGEGEKTFTK